jgi:ribosomal protein S27AE
MMKFYVDEANNYVFTKPLFGPLIIRQDELCPRCGNGILFHAPDHLYCHQCETRFDLPEDQVMRLINAPTLPGLEL